MQTITKRRTNTTINKTHTNTTSTYTILSGSQLCTSHPNRHPHYSIYMIKVLKTNPKTPKTPNPNTQKKKTNKLVTIKYSSWEERVTIRLYNCEYTQDSFYKVVLSILKKTNKCLIKIGAEYPLEFTRVFINSKNNIIIETPFQTKGTNYTAYFKSLQAYFAEQEINNITQDPNQSLFLVNIISTTASADQIATEIQRHYPTIRLTEQPR